VRSGWRNRVNSLRPILWERIVPAHLSGAIAPRTTAQVIAIPVSVVRGALNESSFGLAQSVPPCRRIRSGTRVSVAIVEASKEKRSERRVDNLKGQRTLPWVERHAPRAPREIARSDALTERRGIARTSIDAAERVNALHK